MLVRHFENILAATLMAVVWIIPNHQFPWQSFHHELAIGVALICAFGLAYWQGKWSFPLSPAVVCIILFALVPWAQWLAGLIVFSGHAFIVSLYIVAIGGAFALGEVDAIKGARLLKIVFAALILAALLNVPVQILQWYQWYSANVDSWLMILVPPLAPGDRPSGMILQPNQLATIYVWALISLTFYAWQHRISLAIFIFPFIFIHVGLGITQSRIGLVELAVVSLLLFAASTHVVHKKIVMLWMLGIVIQLIWAVNFVDIAKLVGIPNLEGVSVRTTALDSVRLDGWQAFLAAISSRPWFGFGLGEVGYAYTTVASSQPEMFIGARFAHAHNILLDLMLWVGVPLAVLILGAISVWLVSCLRFLRARSELLFPFAMLMAFGAHSLVELPHYFLYFLAPAAIFAGEINSVLTKQKKVLPALSWMTFFGGGIFAAGCVLYDYLPYQDRYTEWRYEAARVGVSPGIELKPPLVLNQIHDELALYRLRFDEDLDDQKLMWVNRTAASVASPAAYHVAAMANAHLGHFERARDWMNRMNAILSEDEVGVMQSTWRSDQARLSSLVNVEWPPYRGKYRNAPGFETVQ